MASRQSCPCAPSNVACPALTEAMTAPDVSNDVGEERTPSVLSQSTPPEQ
jgi:hypothetical protein